MENFKIEQLDALINTAADVGINEALEQYGDAIDGREATALSQLSFDELQSLARINAKISDLAGRDFAKADWTCGAVC